LGRVYLLSRVYLLGRVYLFWAHLFMFILAAYVRSDKLEHSLTFHHYSGMSAPYPNHTLQASLLSLNPHARARSPKVTPYTINCDVTATMPDSARLNRRVSGSTLLQQHHPNLTSVGESCILIFFVFGKLTELPN
jgi:serine/threonine protein kinase